MGSLGGTMVSREDEFVEFKKSTSEIKECVISIASMLNKNGKGTVYFGIKNDGTIVGLNIGQHTTSDISKAIKEHLKPCVVPTITVLEEKGKQIVSVLAQGEDTPYSAYGRYYIRSDDEDLIMTNSQLESFFLGKNYDYSKWEKELTEYGIDSIDEDLLIKYINQGNDCGRISFLYRDAESALNKLELLNNGRLNNAGYYLFSNQKPLLLKLATYPTDERISFSDMKQFRGNIFECIDEAVKYVTNNIHWRAEIRGMERVETPEIPVEAFREIIVNSFAHMKVNPSSSNEMYITPTRVHIYNPGPLVPGTDPIMFAKGKQGSMIRNPLIATVLYYNRTIDAFGTGFERVFRLCGEENCRYSNNQFGFTFEFIRSSDMTNDTINGRINEMISKDEEAVLRMIREGKHYTIKEISEHINKSVTTVNRIIKKLTEKKLIKRMGSNKRGYWTVL